VRNILKLLVVFATVILVVMVVSIFTFIGIVVYDMVILPEMLQQEEAEKRKIENAELDASRSSEELLSEIATSTANKNPEIVSLAPATGIFVTTHTLPDSVNMEAGFTPKSLDSVKNSDMVDFDEYSTIKNVDYFLDNQIVIYDDKGQAVWATLGTGAVTAKAGTIKKLAKVDSDLKSQGYTLVILVGYRSEMLQEKLREHLKITLGISDGRFDLVASPGKSMHQQGQAVDVTIEKTDGSAIEVPSVYLDFSDDRLPANSKNNVALQALIKAMKKQGMNPYSGEWWHYTDGSKY